MPDAAQHLGTQLGERGFGVGLQRQAIGEINGHEVPGLAALLDDRAGGAVGDRVGVPVVVNAVGRAVFVRQSRRACAIDDGDTVLFLDKAHHGQRDRGVHHVGEHVDMVDVNPFACLGHADVRLVLVIRGEDLDGLAQDFAAKILDRHLGRDDGARPGDIGKRARHVGQHANLDDLVGYLRRLRARKACGQDCRGDERGKSR